MLTADFDLIALGRYLKSLGIFEHGEAFVVEVGEDGTRRVIAHPDPHVIVGPVEADGEEKDDILPLGQIRSVPVRALMATVPRGSIDPHAGLSKAEFPAEGNEYVGAWEPLVSRHDVHWLIGITVPRDDLMSPVERSNLETLVIGLVSLLLSTMLAVALARRISQPLRRLAAETEAIGHFRLDPKPHAPTRLAELSRLNGAMEEMKAGLRSFQKFVPAELVRAVLSTGHEIALGGERKTLTVLFTDIVGFTPMAERLAPEKMVEVLGRYFEAVGEEIEATGGTVDKYMGDSVMAFWGAPIPKPTHAMDACVTALGIRRRIAALSAVLEGEGLPPLTVRVGVATGELIVGNIGSRTRLSYTVIGDPVNLASRLESLNKRYATTILVAEATREAVGDVVVARPIERVAVKGKSRSVLVYELLGLRGGRGPGGRGPRVARRDRDRAVPRPRLRTRGGPVPGDPRVASRRPSERDPPRARGGPPHDPAGPGLARRPRDAPQVTGPGPGTARCRARRVPTPAGEGGRAPRDARCPARYPHGPTLRLGRTRLEAAHPRLAPRLRAPARVPHGVRALRARRRPVVRARVRRHEARLGAHVPDARGGRGGPALDLRPRDGHDDRARGHPAPNRADVAHGGGRGGAGRVVLAEDRDRRPGQRDAGTARRREAPGDERDQDGDEVAYPEGALGPAAVERLSIAKGFKAGTTYPVDAFEAEAKGFVDHAEVTVGPVETVDVLGREKSLYRTEVKSQLLPGPQVSWVDEAGTPWVMEIPAPMFGTLRMVRTEEAVAKADVEPKELFVKSLIEPKGRIDAPRALRHARYRIVGRGLDRAFPDAVGQKVVAREDGAIVLEVAPPDPAQVEGVFDPPYEIEGHGRSSRRTPGSRWTTR